jgi:hypothetical protein
MKITPLVLAAVLSISATTAVFAGDASSTTTVSAKSTFKQAGDGQHIDVYEDVLEGLNIEEIELADDNEIFAVPNWIGLEITGIAYYGKWATLTRYSIENVCRSGNLDLINFRSFRSMSTT